MKAELEHADFCCEEAVEHGTGCECEREHEHVHESEHCCTCGCGCGHDDEEDEMTPAQKVMLGIGLALIVGGIIMRAMPLGFWLVAAGTLLAFFHGFILLFE